MTSGFGLSAGQRLKGKLAPAATGRDLASELGRLSGTQELQQNIYSEFSLNDEGEPISNWQTINMGNSWGSLGADTFCGHVLDGKVNWAAGGLHANTSCDAYISTWGVGMWTKTNPLHFSITASLGDTVGDIVECARAKLEELSAPTGEAVLGGGQAYLGSTPVDCTDTLEDCGYFPCGTGTSRSTVAVAFGQAAAQADHCGEVMEEFMGANLYSEFPVTERVRATTALIKHLCEPEHGQLDVLATESRNIIVPDYDDRSRTSTHLAGDEVLSFLRRKSKGGRPTIGLLLDTAGQAFSTYHRGQEMHGDRRSKKE